MKIAFITNASGGGAGLAATRLAKAVKDHTNIYPELITGDKLRKLQGGSASHFSTLSITTRTLTNTLFTLHKPGLLRQPILDFLNRYDIINIHWTSFCLTEEEILALAHDKKIFITFHDFFHATGGCHYPAGCVNYLMGCSGCPQVHDYLQNHVESRFIIKNNILCHPNVSLLSPSDFLGSAVSIPRSLKLKTHVIRNPYGALDKIPKEFNSRKYDLLLIADSLEERRKGMADAIKLISKMDSRLNIAIVGKLDRSLRELLAPLAISNNVNLTGQIRNHATLVDLYLESKFIFTPSYEDNWPNTLVESGSYGVVPIVFNGHGCQEFVEQLGTGLVLDRNEMNKNHSVVLDYTKQSFCNRYIQEYACKVRALHEPATIALQFLAIAKDSQIQSQVGFHSAQIPYKLLLPHAKPIKVLEYNYVKDLNDVYGTTLNNDSTYKYSSLHDECYNRYRAIIRSAIENPWKFISERIPSKHNFLSPELLKDSQNVVCVDAFPRSANTYLTYLCSLLMYCNIHNARAKSVAKPEDLAILLQERLISKRFVHHTHNPFIAAALLSLNLPVLSVLRNPADSIPSLLKYLGKLAKPTEVENNIRLFLYWVYFYIDFRFSMNLKVLSFSQVTKSSESVANALVSLGLIDSNNPLALESIEPLILSAIELFDKKYHAEKASSRIAVPSKYRDLTPVDIGTLPQPLMDLIEYSNDLYKLCHEFHFSD